MNNEMQQEQGPRFTWRHWSMVMAGIISLILLYSLIKLVEPYTGGLGPIISFWVPVIGNITGGTIAVSIPSAVIGLGLRFWHNARLKSLQVRTIKPNANGAYAAVYEYNSTFAQPENAPLPNVVPQTLTMHQQNDGAMVRLLERLIKSQAEMPALPETTVEEERPLPKYVEYTNDIRGLIPAGHALVGVTGTGVETKEDEVRALLWIVGGSGSGKTNSTVIRVDDDARNGHRFLIADPHWFKDDSLTNALNGYEHLFVRAIARSPEDIEAVLDTFTTEFYGRRDEGWPCDQAITLAVDEVGALTVDIDKSDKLAIRIAEKLKKVAQICGQESRGFNMLGIYISQNAAGLAWLRRYAVMVLAHQVVDFDERKRVCQNDMAVVRDMPNWPKGRTYVYGIAFDDGPLMVQQPVVKRRIVDATAMPPLSARNSRSAYRSSDEAAIEADAETNVTPLFRASTQEFFSSSKDEKEKVSDETKRIILRLSKRGNATEAVTRGRVESVSSKKGTSSITCLLSSMSSS